MKSLNWSCVTQTTKCFFSLAAHKNVCCLYFTPAAFARNLGVTFDLKKYFRQHISQRCCCICHILDLSRIRWCMSLSVAKTKNVSFCRQNKKCLFLSPKQKMSLSVAKTKNVSFCRQNKKCLFLSPKQVLLLFAVYLTIAIPFSQYCPQSIMNFNVCKIVWQG